MKNYDWINHVKGESKFLDDLPVPEGTLHAFVFTSSVAKGKIKSIDTTTAENYPGINKIITYRDIPGENQIGTILRDEPLLAEHEVDFIGQPIAILVGTDADVVREAARLIKCEITELPPIVDPREAFEKGELIIPPQIFSLGNCETAWQNCAYVIEGSAESGGQEHLYLETQSAYSIPVEGGGIKIFSSTQSPTAVQRVTAGVLGLPMHKVEVDVLRLGGGFGGKENQATMWAAISGLASFILKLPVKIILSRHEDMMFTGKRHPYSSDYKIGLNKDGKILAYDVQFYQNAGAASDLSPAILERTLFHCTNSYFVPNVKATAYSCRTNLPPNTAFRGFGGPQAMFVFECAIHKAAAQMGIDASVIQENNLLNESDEFPYGQLTKNCMAQPTWYQAKNDFDFEDRKKAVSNFNSKNKLVKRGIAAMPICFGISFTNTMLNQASALVHVYTDGSVSVSTAAIEMGQGVNMKMRQVAASIFSIDISKVKIETTNTTRIANTSPTAASSGADLNGRAVEKACLIIFERLRNFSASILDVEDSNKISFKDDSVYLDGKTTGLKWNDLILKAYLKRINLSSHAHYITPNIHFDKSTSKGNPFAYHVYGTAIIEVEVDCLRGIYKLLSVKAVHDFGKSMSPVIDRSQAEGAIMQGIGWATVEELLFDEKGKYLTDTLSTYKVPDVHFTPEEMEVKFLENNTHSEAIFNSKAIGEPPLMYGIGAYFAIANAVKSFKTSANFRYSLPITPEKVLMNLHGDKLTASGIVSRIKS
ncbi:MAG: molybdopterin-dependent oxidoreductase [Ignavibacteriaceae bacterium]|nr:molybdopterin-dependent oxidoreductase [Ignavibacteriaceae bacterium]